MREVEVLWWGVFGDLMTVMRNISSTSSNMRPDDDKLLQTEEDRRRATEFMQYLQRFEVFKAGN